MLVYLLALRINGHYKALSMKKLIAAVFLSMVMSHAVAQESDLYKGFKAFQAGEYDTTIAYWEPLAQQGNVDAQSSLAALYRFGFGVEKNAQVAVKWYGLAADQGDAAGQYGLATMYANGEGVPLNDAMALKWYTLSADQGDADAQLSLGSIYNTGQGVVENDETAVSWYTLAAKQGLVEAQAYLGVMYENGDGIAQDTDKAYMWYNIAGYGGNELGAKNQQALAQGMSTDQKAKLQQMSNQCLGSQYTDC